MRVDRGPSDHRQRRAARAGTLYDEPRIEVRATREGVTVHWATVDSEGEISFRAGEAAE